MKVNKLNSFYFTKSIENHNFHKNIILKLIEKIPKNKFENISHTDWTLPNDYKREYLEYFKTIINSYILEIRDYLNTEKYIFENCWFQQYYQNDDHSWHTHELTQFANVYFVELPNKHYKTEIFDNTTNTLIDLDVKEGDVITFPSFYSHRSKPNISNERKTIIAFNSSFYISDQNKINTIFSYYKKFQMYLN